MAGKKRKYGAPKNWKNKFIVALGETSNVAASAIAAEISLSWVYKLRREDAAFRRRWFAALCEGYDNLEMELLYRLRTGRIEETDEDGSKRKFDIGTAFRILAAHKENVSREKARRSRTDRAEILASINRKIDAMRARERDIERLAKDGALPSPRREDEG